MTRIVGIDLGTSTSAIAVFEMGQARVIQNDQGQRVTPSAVWSSPSGELVAGAAAYKQPDSVREYKRLMGTDDKLSLGRHKFAAQECSALMLKYLLSLGREELGEDIDRAVVTVPASWKDGPRRATTEAGSLAGVDVVRLINEPTAAAMAFGARPEAEGKVIAVYDLGGGTFDVTILKIKNKIFDVVTSVGDGHLGGTDIDRILVDHVLQETEKTSGFSLPRGVDPKIDRALALAVESAKKELSFARESHLSIPFIGVHEGSPVGVDVMISRSRLERWIEPLIDRTMQHLQEALRQSKLGPEAIDDVVMVGGSSRIPLARQRVAELFGREPNTAEINPDEAVALGAAIQDGVLDEREASDDGMIILDVTNNNLGVETAEIVNDRMVKGVFSPIILKNSKLPVTRTETYATLGDNQSQIEVKCFQGNSRMTAANEMVGESILVDGLPPRPAGEVAVEITFSLTPSEVLDVGVQVSDAGIMTVRSFDLGGSQHDKSLREESQKRVDDAWQQSELAGRYKVLVDKAEQALAQNLQAPVRSALNDDLEELKTAIIAGDAQAAADADLEISNVLFDLE